MSFISIQNLTKSWGEAPAVNDMSFDVAAGEFLALLGPSGCGKSTTLMMLAGLENPTDGQIHFNQKNVTDLAPGKRKISMVFQSYALFPHLSVKENILFGLKARHVDPAERNKRLSEVLELVDLGAHMDKKPGQLSGGQCQRVALARAIVSHAPICLMDEPLSNLDAKLRNEMRSEIRSLQKKLGLTVIYVTHDQIEAMSMADRVALLNKGCIEQIGRPEELYDQPATDFVAGFIGHPPMNLIPDEETILGIRPEHIRLDESEGISSKVVNCDYHGANTLISTKFCGHILNFMIQGHRQYPAGHTLKLNWDRGQAHYFSRTTGQRMADITQNHFMNEGLN
ncbi:ABC transporter ATP-binding protein [Curvivirga aplysinae]|uniref:ABC transporter ATP-binding protein n=1 Tax=Curvivirga aplysinae TaxID=2529852 RepID=UPI0012BD23C6|nr:ABC transporter ATP-binding protein [Curvivirga aplysinae]MTI10103.1 ABC transporter ATP-binding protein [Curvivirga aplysinae]